MPSRFDHQRKKRGKEQRDERTTREVDCEKSALDGERHELSVRNCQLLIGDSTHCMYILFYIMYSHRCSGTLEYIIPRD